MCLVSTPKAPAPPPPPSYLHNPYLDGVTFGMGANNGRNSLVTGSVSNGLSNVAMPAGGGPNIAPDPARSPMRSLVLGAGTTAGSASPGTVAPTVQGGVMAGVLMPPAATSR